MNKPLILVVEDDTSIRNLITTTLKTNDYRHVVAMNGKMALMEATSHRPDIVLLDLGLPDMDGIEVIKNIRSWSNMPIIVISARSEDNDKIEALDAGAEDFSEEEDSFEILTDPNDFSEVRLALEEAGIPMASAEVTMIPQTWVTLDNEEDIKNIQKTLDLLEDDDDVQEVYHNWEEA